LHELKKEILPVVFEEKPKKKKKKKPVKKFDLDSISNKEDEKQTLWEQLNDDT